MSFNIDLNKTFRLVDRQAATFIFGEESIKSYDAIKKIGTIAAGCFGGFSVFFAANAITGLIAGAVVAPVLCLITSVALGILAHDFYIMVSNKHERFTRATSLISTIISKTPRIQASDFKGTVLSRFPKAQEKVIEAIVKIDRFLEQQANNAL